MDLKTNIFNQEINVFNSPLEIGLRALFILDAIKPMSIDISRLVIYDYFLLNSKDFPNGPESLHPPIPHRSAQILVKPPIMQQAMALMSSRELISVDFTSQGIMYRANDLTSKFVELQENEYSTKLKDLSAWIGVQFNEYTDDRLNKFVKNNISNWGSEFIYESLMRE